MDTIHPWCPVTPGKSVKSVKLHQGWIWFLLSLLIRNTTCPDILWGNICLWLFILAMLKIWKGREKKKAAVGRNHKNTLCNALPSFLSPLITGQHAEKAEDVWRIPEQGLHFGSVALWTCMLVPLLYMLAEWILVFDGMMKAVVVKQEISQLHRFLGNESVKSPF